ncbi:MAG: NAD(P)-dependent alcohol dehydrogenase [Spirochaetes bacterium]|nr:NAD(P)-dependent alcohol dehydrogenase [Spirochaetota bacterium]
MKAIICTKYGGPEVLQLDDVAKPTPGDNEVLIKICATIVSPVDIAFRRGVPFLARLFSGLTRPKYIPGDVLTGEIVEMGKNIRLFKKGDLVFGTAGTTFGTNAEYTCLSEKEALVIKPNDLSFSEAASLCDGGITALPFLRDVAKLKAGQKVLINGASGSVGTFAVQLAKYFGAEVIGVCSTDNLELVQSLGADQVIDYTKEDFTRSHLAYDIIFDAVGKSSYSKCKKSLTKNGIYLTTTVSLSIFIQTLLTSQSKKRKAIFSATGLRSINDKKNDLLFLKNLVQAGKLKVVIDRHYDLEQIADAHKYVEKGHKKGNVVINFDTSRS